MKKDAVKLSGKIVRWLKPYCSRIKIAGSIRRKERDAGDIDIVLIPKDKPAMEEFMRRKGKYIRGGEKESTFMIEGIKVELYYTIPEEWGACLLAYSSEKGAGIGLRMVAKKKGFKLNQHGLFKSNRRIAGKSEREIYEALGRKWKVAEKR